MANEILGKWQCRFSDKFVVASYDLEKGSPLTISGDLGIISGSAWQSRSMLAVSDRSVCVALSKIKSFAVLVQ